jgi:hypothetical protein
VSLSNNFDPRPIDFVSESCVLQRPQARLCRISNGADQVNQAAVAFPETYNHSWQMERLRELT